MTKITRKLRLILHFSPLTIQICPSHIRLIFHPWVIIAVSFTIPATQIKIDISFLLENAKHYADKAQFS